jgi:hypothetical protein
MTQSGVRFKASTASGLFRCWTSFIAAVIIIAMHANVDSVAREKFYELLGEAPESEGAWAKRQAALRSWRVDPRFEPYWPTIDQMLTVDFASFKRRLARAGSAGDLEGYDFAAWREQREYDLKHAGNHLP